MRQKLRAYAAAFALAVFAGPFATPAWSQQGAKFPQSGKPITIIVPYAAGGTTDTGARWLAAALEKELGTTVNVVNRPGAASQVGVTQLVNSRPDGYTLSYAVLPTVITHYLDPQRGATYTRSSFHPIAHHHLVPAMIAVKADGPHKTLADFIAAAKKAPETIKISDSGLMGNPHLAVLLLERASGARFASVHFDGGAPSVTALLGGHVDALAGGISDAVPHVKTGAFRVLGIAAEQESDLMPGVPTMKAQGHDAVSVSATGIVAPAGTPKEVVDTLTGAIKKIVESDEHKQKLKELGVSAHYLAPDGYAKFWTQYEQRLEPILKDLKKS